MAENEELFEKVYAVCLQVAVAMGDDLKGMSWFARNQCIDKIPSEE